MTTFPPLSESVKRPPPPIITGFAFLLLTSTTTGLRNSFQLANPHFSPAARLLLLEQIEPPPSQPRQKPQSDDLKHIYRSIQKFWCMMLHIFHTGTKNTGFLPVVYMAKLAKRRKQRQQSSVVFFVGDRELLHLYHVVLSGSKSSNIWWAEVRPLSFMKNMGRSLELATNWLVEKESANAKKKLKSEGNSVEWEMHPSPINCLLRILDNAQKSSCGPANQVNPTRFRPYLVISGGEPYVEDGWKNLKIRSKNFKSLGGCNHCPMINFDHQEGHVQKSNEPLLTLASYRRVKGKILFGILLRLEDATKAEQDTDSWISSWRRSASKLRVILRDTRETAYVKNLYIGQIMCWSLNAPPKECATLYRIRNI